MSSRVRVALFVVAATALSCSPAEPNAGHGALAALARRLPEVTLVTESVSGLQARAGGLEARELHG